jgi:lipopolysaccharide/colanic/teichoic acid biosynthesis glycosyltransferase
VPIIGVLVIVTRLSSPGPGIFKQRRVGKNGRVFTMYKIRSMRSDAEAKTGAVWCVNNDPRITRVGYWLRKLHLDEFPQLVNVLRGEMSLVGPRPERPEFVEVLARQIPDYYDRLAVPPGITGLAQVNLPPDTDLDSVRRKLLLDQEYIANASLLFDLRMMLATFLRLLGLGGGRSLTLMRLHRAVELPAREDDLKDKEENPFVKRITCEDGNGHGKNPSIRDTVRVDLGDTVEFPRFSAPQASSDSEDGETSDGEKRPQHDGSVSPDRIAPRVSKAKPR